MSREGYVRGRCSDSPRGVPMTEGKNIQFDIATIKSPSVFCEMCGVDVLVEELVKAV